MPTARRPRPKTSRGSLSDLAAHLILPKGIVATGWPAVRGFNARGGIAYDQWQDDLGKATLAKTKDGLYAAGIGGVVVSICRQTGKTFLFGTTFLALCSLNAGLKVLWTSHHSRTNSETFAKLMGLQKRAPFVARSLKPRIANGEQELRFRNGSRILFGARETGFGRGFDDVDVEIFDEAQILTERALDDMIASMNVSPNALAVFMGTPPAPADPSEAFSEKRRAALGGSTTDMLYVEFAADRNGDPESRAQWRKANPSFPGRTSETAILRMRRQLSADSFRREGLGVWDNDAPNKAISKDAWGKLETDSPPTSGGRVAFGVKFSPDGSVVSLAACRRPDEGSPHVELVQHRSLSAGVGWLADWLAERWRKTVGIVVDGKAGTATLLTMLRDRGVPERVVRAADAKTVIAANARFLQAVRDGSLTHFGQPPLTDSVLDVTKRPIGPNGGFGWLPTSVDGDTTPTDAVCLALNEVMSSKRHPGRKTKAVIM